MVNGEEEEEEEEEEIKNEDKVHFVDISVPPSRLGSSSSYLRIVRNQLPEASGFSQLATTQLLVSLLLNKLMLLSPLVSGNCLNLALIKITLTLPRRLSVWRSVENWLIHALSPKYDIR